MEKESIVIVSNNAVKDIKQTLAKDSLNWRGIVGTENEVEKF